MTHQQISLASYAETGWDYVAEAEFEERIGYLCPDCGQEMSNLLKQPSC